MMKMKRKMILIYDDDPEHGESLAKLLRDQLGGSSTGIDVVCNKNDAIRLLDQNAYYIIFLDIMLDDDKNGIEIGRMIREKHKASSLVYITAYIKYCEEIFVNSPDAFLLKPFSEESVKRTLDIIRRKNRSADHICIGAGKNAIENIALDNIVYIESSSRRLRFFGPNMNPMYQFYNIKLTEILPKLPDYFVRCHQSIVVNMNAVKRIERYFFVMENGREIPISQGRFAETRMKYLEFLGDRI